MQGPMQVCMQSDYFFLFLHGSFTECMQKVSHLAFGFHPVFFYLCVRIPEFSDQDQDCSTGMENRLRWHM